MAIDGSREFPYCQICLIACALISHTAVLLGNLQTAKTISTVGESAGGWSDVGLQLSNSLSDLSATMATVSTSLTDALDMVIQVETDMNYIIGSIANSTDYSLSTMQAALIAAEAENKSKLNPCRGGSCKADSEDELSSLLQMGVEHQAACAADVCSHGDELSSLLQGRVQMKLSEETRSGDTAVDVDAKAGQPTIPKINVPSNAVTEARSQLQKEAAAAVGNLKANVAKLLDLIKPALTQIGTWLETMGDKVTDYITEFSTVLDIVQKIFDQVMEQVAGQETVSDVSTDSLFSIFDTDESGYVTLKNFQDMADLYGITEFQGAKGQELMTTYDSNQDGQLSEQEFGLMIQDDSIPKVSSMVLRTFGKKLSQVSGQVGDAVKRDEVAYTVTQYLTLVCSKNMTKMKWASSALGNGSLPVDFVADVLKQFAENAQDPSMVSVVDVGGLTIQEISKASNETLSKAMQKLADPGWWQESGFDAADQADIVQMVSTWVHNLWAPGLLEFIDVGSRDQSADQFALSVHAAVSKRSRQFAARQRARKAKELDSIFSSDRSVDFFRGLTGRSVLVGSGLGEDVDVSRVVNSGADASAATLAFAAELAANASDSASLLQNISFDSAHTSSNSLDSFAMQVQNVLSKISTFLNLMQRYSTPSGIEDLETMLENFINNALDDVLKIIDQQINSTLSLMTPNVGSFLEVEAQQSLTGVWNEIISFTSEIKSALPSVIDNIKYARREVSSVSATMNSIFSVFGVKGWPIFNNVQTLYARLWVAYYMIFVMLCSALCFYAFWSVGYFGGPEVDKEESGDTAWYTAWCPSTQARCADCCHACVSCLDKYTDSPLCWWSAILFANIIVLLMFFISCILVLLAAVKMFLLNGCAEIYLLSDNAICQELLQGIQKWLNSFWYGQPVDISEVCVSKTLMTCGVISGKLQRSTVFTICGSVLAIFFTVQIILESARLHESARWRRMKEENTLPIIEEETQTSVD